MIMKTRVFLGLIGITIALALFAVPALAGKHIVNCDKGQSLQKAILSGHSSAAPIEIRVFGTCQEDIEFTRDNVSVIGDGNTTLVGHIRIASSDEVSFRDLTVTGPGPGVTVFNGRIRFSRVKLVDTEGVCVVGRQGSVIRFVDSQISGHHGESGAWLEHSFLLLSDSEVNGNWGDGITVSSNSSVRLQDSWIHMNGGSGIHARLSSVVEATNSQFNGNGAVGIYLRTGSSGEIRDSGVAANGAQGLEVTGHSTLDVYGGIIVGNGDHGVWVSEHAFFRLIDAEISGNTGHGLVVGRDGGVILEGNSKIENNSDENFQVVCQGKEASIDIVSPAITGPIDCPDPDF
jgi:hypothetical protein